MKTYLSIPGWRQATLGLPCLAFEKLDGSNIRAEWSENSGFYKFGSRNVLLDPNHPDLGEAISLFKNTLADKFDALFRSQKNMPEFYQAVVYMEFYGAKSAFGQHVVDDPKTLTVIDIDLHKRGFVLPSNFVNWFSDFPIAKVLYSGIFNQAFIDAVRNGEYGTGEGIVAKGIDPHTKKNPQHSLWMAKVKTNDWLSRLKTVADESPEGSFIRKVLAENIREQVES